MSHLTGGQPRMENEGRHRFLQPLCVTLTAGRQGNRD